MNKYLRRQLGIKKAKRVMKVWLTRDNFLYKNNSELIEFEFRHLLKTKVRCSCLYCGNPRRHFGQKTIQEKKADLELDENQYIIDYL